VIDREDEVGGVAGRPTRVGQRAFVDLDDVTPTELGEMAHHRIAHDPGAEDDDARTCWKITHSETSISWLANFGRPIDCGAVAD
jgi:hypothetical protein